MKKYQEIVDFFQVLGIDNEKKLEAALSSDFETYETGFKEPEPITLGGKIAHALLYTKPTASSGDQDFGIQQFSLCQKPHVPEDDIKKSLFLSRRSTIFTTQPALL